MDLIEFLQKWYFEQCDGDWEHAYGVKIETLDNPGWSVDIDLQGTDFADKHFEPKIFDHTEKDWVDCRVEDQIFQGRGGPQNLADVLKVFRGWVEEMREGPSDTAKKQ
jgi:hypothetical protein